MSQELSVVPENIPAHILARMQNRTTEINASALSGISVGFPQSIRISNGRFKIVNAEGEEHVVLPDEMVNGMSLPIVIVNVRDGFEKSYYVGAYNPAEEGKAPDCYSRMGKTPEADAALPQHTSCAGCPHNAFGSGRDQNGNPTKGKACSDNKVMAVFYRGGIYHMKVPPASLKNLGIYVKQLDRREGGISLTEVVTLATFDVTSEFSVLKFEFGGWLDEAQILKIDEFSVSSETMDIVSPSGEKAALGGQQQLDAPAQAAPAQAAPAQAAPAQAAPAQAAPELPAFNIPGFANPYREPGKPSPGKARRTKQELTEDADREAAIAAPTVAATAAPAVDPVADVMGTTPAAQVAPAQTAPPAAAAVTPTQEADHANALGLM